MLQRIKSASRPVEERNEADAVAFRAEKALKEYKEQIPPDVAADVQQKIDALKKALEANDSAKISAAKRDLEEHMQHIGEADGEKSRRSSRRLPAEGRRRLLPAARNRKNQQQARLKRPRSSLTLNDGLS